MKLNKNKNGFSLIEVLLYISIVGFLVLSISGFFSLTISSRSKGQVMMEINNQGAFLMDLISREIRNSEGINYPTVGSSLSSLSLDALGTADDPIVLNESGNIFYKSSGGGSAINLTNNRILITNIIFSNASLPGTPGLINFQFTLNYINSEAGQEYNYSKTFYGSASLR